MFRNKIRILLWVLFLLSFNSIGYDLYSHSLFHHYNNEKITHSYKLFFDAFLMPRYGLLSYIYELFRDIGVPIGWVALILIYIPVLHLTNIGFNYSARKNRVIYTLLSMILMILTFFYSALSLVIIWFLACILTGKRFYLIGASFHPAGFVMGFFYAIIFPGFVKNIIFLLIPICLLAIFAFFMSFDLLSFKFIDVENIKIEIHFDMIWELLSYVFELKPTESTALLILFVVGWVYNKFFRKHEIGLYHRRRTLSEKSYLMVLAIPFTILMINTVLREKDSLFSTIITMKYSDNIYITWFNFGSRDDLGTFDGVNNDRI